MTAHLVLPSMIVAAVGIMAYGAAEPELRAPVRGLGVLSVDESSTNGLNDGSSWEHAYVHFQDALANAGYGSGGSQTWAAEGSCESDHARQQVLGVHSTSYEPMAGSGIHSEFTCTNSSPEEEDCPIHPTIRSIDPNDDDAPGLLHRNGNAYPAVPALSSEASVNQYSGKRADVYHDITSGTSSDCNTNGVPDEYDTAGGARLQAKLVAADGAAFDYFGSEVSVGGDRALVGASGDDGAGIDSGSAYIFRRQGGTWIQDAKLVAADCTYNDYFGGSVSLSGDRALVGAAGDDDAGIRSGSAYVFRRERGIWVEEAKLVADDGADFDEFGDSVSLSGDRALIGVYLDDDAGDASGSAYIFRRENDTWVEEAKLVAADATAHAFFGGSVSLSGDRALVGGTEYRAAGTNAGSAYVFRREGTTWIQEAKLVADDGAPLDLFGVTVSLSGGRALIGAYGDDEAGYDAGAGYVFRREGGAWIQEAKLVAADGADYDYFGVAVSLSGDRAVIGAMLDDDEGPDSGSAYVFRREGSIWVQMHKLVAPDVSNSAYFGVRVSLSGGRALVGAYQDDAAGYSSGSAYAYLLYGDCNSNGIPDECDTEAGTNPDCNLNALPDECEGIARADMDCDGDVDPADLAAWRACHPLFGGATPPGCTEADLNRDGRVDCADWRILRAAWTAGTPPGYSRCRTAISQPAE